MSRAFIRAFTKSPCKREAGTGIWVMAHSSHEVMGWFRVSAAAGHQDDGSARSHQQAGDGKNGGTDAAGLLNALQQHSIPFFQFYCFAGINSIFRFMPIPAPNLCNYDRVSIGTIAIVFPSGASTFKSVSICGLVYPFSILAIIGCFTPLNSSSFFWEMPCSCRAFINSPMSWTRRLLSAISSEENNFFCTSSQLLPIALLFIFNSPF